jgi:hypothetical protein
MKGKHIKEDITCNKKNKNIKISNIQYATMIEKDVI